MYKIQINLAHVRWIYSRAYLLQKSLCFDLFYSLIMNFIKTRGFVAGPSCFLFLFLYHLDDRKTHPHDGDYPPKQQFMIFYSTSLAIISQPVVLTKRVIHLPNRPINNLFMLQLTDCPYSIYLTGFFTLCLRGLGLLACSPATRPSPA